MSFHHVKAQLEGQTLSGSPDDVTGPVKVGGVATAEEPSTVDSGDVVVSRPDLFGNTKIVGNLDHDTVDRGNPVKIGGIARQANPTAVEALDRVAATFDDVGRQVTRPYQVRDLIRTAYASLTSGTKTQLIAGTASAFKDLIQISCYNDSGAATTVTLLDESTTVMTIPAPASSVTTYNFQIPKKQSATGVAWYVDLPDITGTTVEVTADFVEEV